MTFFIFDLLIFDLFIFDFFIFDFFIFDLFIFDLFIFESKDEEQRIDETRRMFEFYIARLIEQQVVSAFREKEALENQRKLIEEEELKEQLTQAKKEATKKKLKQKKQKKKERVREKLEKEQEVLKKQEQEKKEKESKEQESKEKEKELKRKEQESKEKEISKENERKEREKKLQNQKKKDKSSKKESIQKNKQETSKRPTHDSPESIGPSNTSAKAFSANPVASVSNGNSTETTANGHPMNQTTCTRQPLSNGLYLAFDNQVNEEKKKKKRKKKTKKSKEDEGPVVLTVSQSALEKIRGNQKKSMNPDAPSFQVPVSTPQSKTLQSAKAPIDTLGSLGSSNSFDFEEEIQDDDKSMRHLLPTSLIDEVELPSLTKDSWSQNQLETVSNTSTLFQQSWAAQPNDFWKGH